MNDFYKKFRPKEWDKVHVLAFSTSPISVIQTSKKPIQKMEDLKGISLRGTGYIAEVVTALGGTPRAIATPEVYDAIMKNVLQGTYTPMETLKGFRYAEVVKYVTESWPIGQVYTFYLIMNKNTWDKLPPDIKKVFDEYPFEDKFAQVRNEVDIEGKKYGIEKGVQFIQLSQDEAKRWINAAETVIDKYTKSMVKAGYSEKEVKERMDFISKGKDRFLDKETERGKSKIINRAG